MTRITSALAAALIASASFASAALAEGNYYEGVNPSSNGQISSQHRAHNAASYGYTGSIAGSSQQGRDANGTITLNRGDYYEGAIRPN